VSENGRRLGELGSKLTAEVLFGLLRLAENSRPHAVDDDELVAVFGPAKIPANMRAVIDYVGG
jgi:hypothetical protein